MRVLVTGGAGFIGSAACRRLIADGVSVVNADKLTYAANPKSLAAIAHASALCIRARGHLRSRCNGSDFRSVSARCGAASRCRKPRRSLDHGCGGLHSNQCRRHLSTSRSGADNIGRHCRPDRRAGSASFMSRPTKSSARWAGRVVSDEDTPYQPSSPYSASKAGSDHLANAWYRTYGLPVIICNSSNNYGPYQFPEKLIPLAILNAFDGMPVPVYGDGSNVRDWLYVEDFVDGLVKLLERGRPGERYNFGGGGECTNLKVAELICGILDRIAPIAQSRRSLITFVPDRPGPRFALCDRCRQGAARARTGDLAWSSSAASSRQYAGIWKIGHGGNRFARTSIAASGSGSWTRSAECP